MALRVPASIKKKGRRFLWLVLMAIVSCGSCHAAVSYWKTFEETDIHAKFLKENAWLMNKSRWSLHVDTSKQKLPRSRLGAFAVGNGYAFTLIGLNQPLNTLHGMTGPTYSSPFFGDEWIEVSADGEKTDLPKQRIWLARGTAVVVTQEKNDQIELYTVNFAPPGLQAIMRVLIVKNISAAALKNVSVVCKLYGDKEETQNEMLQKRDDRLLSTGALDEKAYVENGGVVIPFGDVAPGGEKTAVHYLILTRSDEDKTKTLSALKKERLTLLSKTKAYWDKWLSDALKIITPDEKVNDFIEGMAVSLKIQQMANGAQVPVVKYADRSHDRENVNIARFLLFMGKFEDVKDMILFCYKAAIKNGEIINSQDILTDVAHLPPEPDWETMPLDNINAHYHAAERPSWTILQFYWYYKHTDDAALIKKVYPYLRRNLAGQEITDEGLLPFHGDDMGQIIFPMYVSKAPLEKMVSADSSFAFVAAAEGMREMAERLGKKDDAVLFKNLADKVRNAAEKHYWLTGENNYVPALMKDSGDAVKQLFADIGLKPVWTGYVKYGDEIHAKKNLLSHINVLLRTDGTLKMAQNTPVYFGQVPGLFLYNLSYFDHPHAEKAFNAIDFIADPAGQFAEAHKNNHLPLAVNMDATGLKKEDARRLGPWEGSVNAYAAAFYLTGIAADAQKNELLLAPHLPNGWEKLQVKNCHVGKNVVDFEVFDPGRGVRVYSIMNKGKEKISVNVTASFLKKAEVKKLIINNKEISADSFVVDDEWGTTRIKNIKADTLPKSKVKIEINYH